MIVDVELTLNQLLDSGRGRLPPWVWEIRAAEILRRGSWAGSLSSSWAEGLWWLPYLGAHRRGGVLL